MPTPVRYPQGISTDFPFGPLANYGLPNPLDWHQAYDDFDQALAATGPYTATKTGNGTIALTAGDGGLALFTTNSSTPVSTDICSIQLPVAGFTFSAGKKSFFSTRLKLSSAVNNALIAGLIQTTTTPFTVTDGLYFYKASGAATLLLRHSVGSVNTDIAIPSTAFQFADATYIDLSWYVDAKQNISAFVGSQLFGYIPQSGTGAANSSGVSTLPVKGPVAGRDQSVSPLTLTTANLNPTLALQSGTGSSKTMTADFWLAAKER